MARVFVLASVLVALVGGSSSAAWAVADVDATVEASAACVTTKRVIARDLRRQNAYPVVQGMKARDVTRCRGKWAVVTRKGMGDTSFNARYAKGRWKYNAGYPMGPCGRAPSWLCPNHP